MKNYISILFLVISISLNSQTKDYSVKVQTIDSTIKTLYGVISGEKGEARNWELFKYLFHKDAKLIPSGANAKGEIGARFISPQEYIDTSGKWLIDNGFYEVEIGRTTERFGNIAQIFTSYESFHSKTDKKPFMRGINSIQLLHDGSRWWVLNIFWQQENEKQPIPKKYLN